MKCRKTAQSNGGGRQTLKQPPVFYNLPDVQHEGRSSEGLRKEEHNYQGCQPRQAEQVSDDGDARLHVAAFGDLGQQEVFRKHHTDHPELSMLDQVPSPKISPKVPLPSPEFCWCAPDTDLFALYYKDSYTHILIQALYTGSYLVVIGEHDPIDIPTLRQAQTICHAIAWVFRDSLPVPNTQVNTDTREPKFLGYCTGASVCS